MPVLRCENLWIRGLFSHFCEPGEQELAKALRVFDFTAGAAAPSITARVGNPDREN